MLPWTLTEVERRVAILRDDVALRRAEADHDVNAQGIHQSQIKALDLMMTDLLQRQDNLLQQLHADPAAQSFAQLYSKLLAEIAGAHGLWRVFRYIFNQRNDQKVKAQLDAADLIAADCYQSCIDQARTWGLIDKEYREPPLVYLDAEQSALTASRGVEARALGMAVGQYRALRLPIPIILLPVDQVDSFWCYTTLHHEVGHNLDQDLRSRDTGQRLGEEMEKLLIQKLSTANVDLSRRQVWQRWCDEMLADAFGVLLGGAGFAYTLAALLLPQASIHADVVITDAHPDTYVRIYLVAALLRRCQVAQLTSAADWIKQRLEATPQPTAVASFKDEIDLAADLLLDTPLTVLGGRPLRALAPTLSYDAQQADTLATYLRTGFNRPNPDTFSRRLAPVAAQIAVTRLPNIDADRLALVHSRSLEYLQAIPHPQFLAPAEQREAFLLQLTDAIQFPAG